MFASLESTKIVVENLWDKPDLMNARSSYGNAKMKNNTENPWTWTKGIKTGLDENGERIGPAFEGLPKLAHP
jgi:hypothetical protein